MTKESENDNIIHAFGIAEYDSHGEMAEGLMAPVLKTGDVRASVGSNPTFPAKAKEASRALNGGCEAFCFQVWKNLLTKHFLHGTMYRL